MRIRALTIALETARTAYDQEVDRLAEHARDQLIPYFQKRGWSYTAGNGTWFITDRRGRPLADEQLPTVIYNMLYLEIEHGQYLGFRIRDIP